MGDVVNIPNLLQSNVDLPADTILARAEQHKLTDAIVIGWMPDGSFYYIGSMVSGPEALWLLEQAKRYLLEEHDEEGE